MCRESHFSNNRNAWFCNHESLDAWSKQIHDTTQLPVWCPLPEYCASHSEFQSEREKMLDGIAEILKHEWNNANNLDREYRDQSHTTLLHIRNQLAELRQGEQG